MGFDIFKKKPSTEYPYKSDIHPDIIHLYKETIRLSTFINKMSGDKAFDETYRLLSRSVFFKLHGEAIAMHKAIFDMCAIGWSHIAGIILRTLYDVFITLYIISEDDYEYRAFKYFYWDMLREKIPEKDAEYSKAIAKLNEKDKKRIEDYIKNGKFGGYWFNPEYKSPSDVITKSVGDENNDVFVYKVLSGISHGGHIGIGFFRDAHDKISLTPTSSPKSANRVVASSISRLFGICQLRIIFEDLDVQFAYNEVYNKFMKARNIIEKDVYNP